MITNDNAENAENAALMPISTNSCIYDKRFILFFDYDTYHNLKMITNDNEKCLKMHKNAEFDMAA